MSQYEAMLRLVAAHRSSLLEATRRHVAQALQATGDLRAAENYYIQAGQYDNYYTALVAVPIVYRGTYPRCNPQGTI